MYWPFQDVSNGLLLTILSVCGGLFEIRSMHVQFRAGHRNSQTTLLGRFSQFHDLPGTLFPIDSPFLGRWSKCWGFIYFPLLCTSLNCARVWNQGEKDREKGKQSFILTLLDHSSSEQRGCFLFRFQMIACPCYLYHCQRTLFLLLNSKLRDFSGNFCSCTSPLVSSG